MRSEFIHFDDRHTKEQTNIWWTNEEGRGGGGKGKGEREKTRTNPRKRTKTSPDNGLLLSPVPFLKEKKETKRELLIHIKQLLPSLNFYTPHSSPHWILSENQEAPRPTARHIEINARRNSFLERRGGVMKRKIKAGSWGPRGYVLLYSNVYSYLLFLSVVSGERIKRKRHKKEKIG